MITKHVWLAAVILAFTALSLNAGTILAPEQDKGWPMKGHDNSDNHFSPLSQINTDTVGRLGLSWYLDLPDERAALEATPISVDGVLYFPGSGSVVYAVDAVTGKLLWQHDPEVWKNIQPEQLRTVFRANRGVAYGDGKIVVATNDGRLQGLDAKTGELLWNVRTFPQDQNYFSAGVPRVFKDKVIIGNGGADWGNRGFVTAFDLKTGKQLWRFYTVPGSPEDNAGDPVMEMAAKTWSGEYWKTGTGGTVWHGITYDEKLDRLYIGTGNSGPYNPSVRSPGDGDNLFLVSIVALEPDTGKYIWHYQVNPREAWDYKATADILLADLEIDGRIRPVLMQAPTNGFFYVIDRETGKLISAEKTGKVTWAERIDVATGHPVEAANIRFENGEMTVWPGALGGHNWQAMSFSPQTGLSYIPYMQAGTHLKVNPDQLVGGVSLNFVIEDEQDGKGKLLAWDPVSQKLRWSVQRTTMWNGGVISTAGNLVLQGTEEGIFEIFNAETGEKLWSFNANQGIISAPITYSVAGKQYISLLVGYGGSSAATGNFNKTYWKYGEPRRLLTFALDANIALPESSKEASTQAFLDDDNLVIDEDAVVSGAALFGEKGCSMCHGINLKSVGAQAPDLRGSAIALSKDALGTFLRSDAAARYGMPRFSEITDDQVNSLYMYIRAGAKEALGQRESGAEAEGASRL
ncbi:MAG: PQQ-dependent dehydrogenase, methanol/ethanol family [Porticoccaceae bacterium]|nr:PQQ-dependent dehydrogenase, methanol/ethanol family [Porticoccaceae bacterium]